MDGPAIPRRGRTADYLTLRSGLRRRVTYNVYRISRIEGIREYQLVQKNFDRIEIRMAVRRELTPAEIGLIQEVMQAAFGAAFLIELRYVEALPRTAAGKLRPFISEVEPVG